MNAIRLPEPFDYRTKSPVTEWFIDICDRMAATNPIIITQPFDKPFSCRTKSPVTEWSIDIYDIYDIYGAYTIRLPD